MLRLYLYCELKPLLGFIFILGSWLAKPCVSLECQLVHQGGGAGLGGPQSACFDACDVTQHADGLGWAPAQCRALRLHHVLTASPGSGSPSIWWRSTVHEQEVGHVLRVSQVVATPVLVVKALLAVMSPLASPVT